jgi:hypothetical protein
LTNRFLSVIIKCSKKLISAYKNNNKKENTMSQSKSSAAALLAKLQKQVNDLKQPSNYAKDDRYWQPTIDASGLGSAVLRFLPAKSDDELPFAKTYRHAFQENNSWFIDNCPTTIGQDCPVCVANGVLWNTKLDADKEIARKHKRRLEYIANVLIVKDPGNKENEGQVKLFRFGAKIWEKVDECLNPDPDGGEEAFNPFGLVEGANFNLKIANVAGYRNYDKSKFIKAADIEENEELTEKTHSLVEFTDPKNFKSYDELEQRFLKVLGQAPVQRGRTTMTSEDDDTDDFVAQTSKPVKEIAKAPKTESTETSDKADASIDDDLKFLNDLAGETDPF